MYPCCEVFGIIGHGNIIIGGWRMSDHPKMIGIPHLAQPHRARCGIPRTPTSVFLTTVHCSLSTDDRPQAAVATFFGLPPFRPFALDARAFAALLALPPSSPRRVAIHRFDPKNPSNSAGMYKSASSAGK